MPVKITWPAVGAVILPNVGGWLGGLITRNNLTPWYESLKKPSWKPPNWAFGPVWTGIYCSMGYASYMVLQDSGSWKNAAMPLSVYGANLALNWAWTPIFFGAHNIKLALYELTALWGCTAALSLVFYRVNTTAGLLIIPYLAWSTLAWSLNYVIYRDNELGKSIAGNDEKQK
ncbi:hypothetical protein QAD02_015708 [Eretmocerus hayati]|uniref:Uncharacterized protein n=1 Tax=Eretmocerus hayati TaxID=131215 RepID=A0ACC2PA94_9HYME|nr:hypothetical protein QAD02_015708 [Eretmocerus hayati]